MSVVAGDFSQLAKSYVYRPAYSETALRVLARYLNARCNSFRFADVGAGTGKLTEQLVAMGLTGFAVEPNDAMRAEGERFCDYPESLEWRRGSAEDTGLASQSVDWVLMASSFHWTDPARSLPELVVRNDGARRPSAIVDEILAVTAAAPELTTEHEVRRTGRPPDTRHSHSVGPVRLGLHP